MSVFSPVPSFSLHLAKPPRKQKRSPQFVAVVDLIGALPFKVTCGYFGARFVDIAFTHRQDPHAVAGLVVGLVMLGIAAAALAIFRNAVLTLWKCKTA